MVGPSQDAAWAYYENVTLDRVYADADKNIRAQVDDNSHITKVYPYWQTSLHDMKAFGISVKMYFSSLAILSLILLGVGIFNLPMIAYFWNYTDETNKEGILNSIRGSNICDDYEWYCCESCNGKYSDNYSFYQLDGTYVMKNNCNMSDWLYPAIFSWCALITLITSLMIFLWFQRKFEVVFDKDIQIASDYSIKISNPPPDTLNPEGWWAFFTPFSDKGIACVTIALNSAELLRTLVCRQKVVKELKIMLPIGSDVNDQSTIDETTTNRRIKLPFSSNARDKHEKLKDLNEKNTKLVKVEDYKAVAIFVTFERERGQRNALRTLSIGRKDI